MNKNGERWRTKEEEEEEEKVDNSLVAIRQRGRVIWGLLIGRLDQLGINASVPDKLGRGGWAVTANVPARIALFPCSRKDQTVILFHASLVCSL